MPNLSNNKQLMIHVVSEIAVLAGITFYFTKKNNTLSTRIDELAQRVEEQEDLIQKHDVIIQKLVGYINQQQKQHREEKALPVQKPKRIVELSTPVQTQERENDEEFSTPVQTHERSPKVTFAGIDDMSSEEEVSSEDESDLDADLVIELADLIDEEDESNLKKEPPVTKDA